MLKSPFEPCIASGAKSVPDRPEWIHEIKHDGYRLIVQRDGKRVRHGPATAMTGAIGFR
jgi:bifunctional non-homologous end joining protein LigD